MLRWMKISVLVGAIGLALAPAALAGHVPANGCATPAVLQGSNGAGDYIGICTPLGSLVAGGSATQQRGYVYADGSDNNPEGVQGYAVIGGSPNGTFCQTQGNPGQWNESYSGPQACVV